MMLTLDVNDAGTPPRGRVAGMKLDFGAESWSVVEGQHLGLGRLGFSTKGSFEAAVAGYHLALGQPPGQTRHTL